MTSSIYHLDTITELSELNERFAREYPGIELRVLDVDGDQVLRSDRGGMKVCWIYRGRGEVFLPAGYRTQEGDGRRLPEGYTPDPLDPSLAESLRRLEDGLSAVSPAAAVHVQAILGRRRGDILVGDFAVELWNLEHVARPWATDESLEAAIVSLFSVHRSAGYATKQMSSFEPILAGDQLIVCANEEIPVRGQFRCLTLEKTDRTASHISTARRLQYLLDSAGGCSFDFDPYRRLPLTWYMDCPGQLGDGVNFVNSHVVHIPRELSSTHFHPRQPRVGGLPQTEMYLVLDPSARGLVARGRQASILLFPDLSNLRHYEEHVLAPGDLVYIPPSVGHRGLDVFVNVLTVPGFKPHNEFYIDRDICDRAGGTAPYNEAGFARRNFERLEELL